MQKSIAYQMRFADYDGFVDKFKPKRTTDDCMTPAVVYDAVRDWAVRAYGLGGRGKEKDVKAVQPTAVPARRSTPPLGGVNPAGRAWCALAS
ncbi:MAG: hypothetical protein LBR77_06815 [Lachnospiraceae bacterium]|jgi:hypothetical protein|nr:hypothetical protein [Lachnospiraceae bacterium]